MLITRGLRTLLLLGVLGPAAAAAPQFAQEAAAEELFRERVLPILQQQCFECHGPQARRIKGGLLLNGKLSLLEGGHSGPAVVPGDPDASLLVTAVRRTALDLEMPPDEALDSTSVAVLERWVRLGAAWPEDLVVEVAPAARPDAGTAAGTATAGRDGAAPAPHAAVAAPIEFPPPTHEQLMFFENEVRPLLAQHCYDCHGPELARGKSELRFGGRAALLRGGERGPALVPGNADASLLIDAVRWSDPVLSMPPDNKLSPEQIATLETWVTIGAPWPSSPDDAGAEADDEHAGPDIAAGREWWSFRPVQRPEVPVIAGAVAGAESGTAGAGAGAVGAIDAFVLARLEAQGLVPNPPADRATLARRAHFDLLGLPPTLEEVEAFVRDERPDAWPRLVNSLLERPAYGERWARHWLDVVRWAQTNGYERDTEKPFAWRYRDWVIAAFQDDKPYDRFVLEQLAGDELPEPTDDSIIATGFYRLGVWDDEPDDMEQAAFDELDDHLRIVTEGFLGVTLGCARCHDHKFDPLAQEDYYSTLAFFRNVRGYSAPRFSTTSPTLRPLGLDRDTERAWERDRAQHIAEASKELKELKETAKRLANAKRREALPAGVEAALAQAPGQRTAEQEALLATHAHLLRAPTYQEIAATMTHEQLRQEQKLKLEIESSRTSYEGKLEWALAVREARGPAPETRLLVRGLASSPSQVVDPSFVPVLCSTDADSVPELPVVSEDSTSTGRRLALARWITDPAHPTTARVLVNRVWQHHFGRGIVDTPNDFGRTGTLPTHPELLDWLASEFVAQGWSIKQLHRLIMSTDAYRRSSRAENEAALAQDPGNELLWRQGLRRLEAESVRDAVLAVAGTLGPAPAGRGHFPRLSREALAGGSRPGQGWEVAPPAPQEPRSVYGFVKRSLIPPFLEVFDYGNTSMPVGTRTVTTLASQALILLNSEFMGEQAAAFADRVRREAGDDLEAQITRAFELALARAPDESERAIVRDLYRDEVAGFAAAPRDVVFRSRVPSRVDAAFLAQLAGTDLLFGPRAGWAYGKGRWVTPYNGTLGVDLAAGPVALRDAPVFRDVVLTARVRLQPGCELAAIALRAAPDGEGFSGLELVLDPLAGKARLVAHAAGAETLLGEADAALVPGAWAALRIEAAGERIAVWLDADEAAPPLLEVVAPGHDVDGRFGVRAWGEALHLSDVRLVADGTETVVLPDDPGTPELRALRSLCLLLFNLDEFVYVD